MRALRRTGRQSFPALVVMLVAVGFAALAQEPPVPKPDSAHPAPVLRVVDGDTVVVGLEGKETTVRLIGVDSPETVQPVTPVEADDREAGRFLANLLKGEFVYLKYKPGERTDQYGRTLAYLYRAPEGLFVNLEIIRQGYGRAYTRFPFQHMEEFREAERKAREAGRGLWAPGAERGDILVTSTSGRRTVQFLGISDGKLHFREDARLEGKLRSAGRSVPLDEVRSLELGKAPLERLPLATPVQVGPQEQKTEPKTTPGVTVYITLTGRKYHREECRHLSKRKGLILLKDAVSGGYEPCSVCRPPTKDAP